MWNLADPRSPVPGDYFNTWKRLHWNMLIVVGLRREKNAIGKLEEWPQARQNWAANNHVIIFSLIIGPRAESFSIIRLFQRARKQEKRWHCWWSSCLHRHRRKSPCSENDRIVTFAERISSLLFISTTKHCKKRTLRSVYEGWWLSCDFDRLLTEQASKVCHHDMHWAWINQRYGVRIKAIV